MDCMRDNFVEGVLLDGRFQTVSPLNHGSFGMVFKAVDNLTGEPVALKCLTKPSAADQCAHVLAVDDRSEELAIHRKIDSHPNIVNLVHHFETEHHVYLVLEFCANGDLYEAIRLDRAPGQTEHVRECMLQLVDAVEHMHARSIFHRDIKPENIFLSTDGTMKLGDFGLATMDTWSYESSVGSDRYMAPEQYDHLNAGYCPAKADIWAIGICLLNVLFSRNPFATPTLDDPLFSDFANDRQTLFDVFPNMSQDTYEVLMHCLAIDPTKRSLAGVKAALERAVCFTTEDESLDEFCVEEDPVVITTANREPLRTPSISTPAIDQGGAFPWAKALAMSPPVRQLSAIPDTEDLFVGSNKATGDWFNLKPEPSSVTSFVDSGLGLSLKSNAAPVAPFTFPRSKPVLVSGSLPATMARPIPSMSAIFGGKRELVSKSWSDLWDEDEEAEVEAQGSSDVEDFRLDFEEASDARKVFVNDDSDGSDTPRAVLSSADLQHESVVSFSADVAKAIDDDNVSEHTISEQTGFLFEDLHSSGANTPLASKASAPTKAREALDRWAMLGELRRGLATPKKAAPAPPVLSSATPREDTSRGRRVRAKSWRRGVNWAPATPTAQPIPAATAPTSSSNASAVKDWTLSKDWRQHSSPFSLPNTTTTTKHSYHQTKPFGGILPNHCNGDVRANEWVWRSDNLLHL